MDIADHDIARDAVARARTSPPDAADWLAAWERGQSLDPVGRGLALLALADPALAPADGAALAIGERDRRLLSLRGAMFGPKLAGLVECPACGERLEFEATVGDLTFAPPADLAGTLTLRENEFELRLRLPDSGDLRATSAAVDGETAARALVTRCIVSARRGEVDIDVAALPAELLAHAADRLAAADPQADVRLALSCAACRAACRAPFDIVSFLWAELEAHAERLLWEIHQLALAYGWTERDVLALGPARREAYLRRVLE